MLQIYHPEFNYIVLALNILNLATDGMRLCQIPCMVTSHLKIFLDSKILAIIGLFLSLMMRIIYGEGNFDRIKHRGNHKVAHKEIHFQGHAVSVFYPTQDEGEMYWLRYRNSFDYTKGVLSALGWMANAAPKSHRLI